MIQLLVHEHRETLAAAVVLLAAVVVLPLLACAVDKPADSPAPAPVKLFTVPEYTEGVVFDRDGVGYISSRKVVYRFTLDGKREVWAETGAANGHKILPDGTHLLCDGSHRAVLRLSKDGKLLDPPAAKLFEGKPFEGPNDLTLDLANGGFYFTDPENSNLEHLIGVVYYCDAFDGTGKITRVDTGMAYPNGIVLAPDGKRLYVDESLTNRVHVYDVLAPGKVGPRRIFADLPKLDPKKDQILNLPDGMCLDAAGNLYVAHFGMRNVHVLDPSGKLIKTLESGNLTTSNVAFGGPNYDQLFVTGALGAMNKSEGAVFRIDLGVKGLRLLPK
jgi:gluconolactonase